MRRWSGWVNDLWSIGVQLAESIDQRHCFGCAIHAWITNGMVPHQSGNLSIQEQRTDCGHTGFKRQLRAMAKIEHPILWICRWCVCLSQGPATIKNSLPKVLRDIDRGEISSAERRHEQDKLKIRHSRVLNIKRLHTVPLLMVTYA